MASTGWEYALEYSGNGIDPKGPRMNRRDWTGLASRVGLQDDYDYMYLSYAS